MSVCLFVSYLTPPKRRMIWTCGFLQMVGKLYGMVFIYVSNVFGLYCPKTGHRSKKWTKNGCFLKVFRIIEGVIVMIITLNFNTMQKVLRDNFSEKCLTIRWHQVAQLIQNIAKFRQKRAQFQMHISSEPQEQIKIRLNFQRVER